MDIVVTGRHCTVTDAVREQVTDRLATVERLRDRVIRAEVEFTAEESKGNPHDNMLCEITLRSKGPVIRAEAHAEDKMVAFEKAMDRLKTQLRKASDRRKSHRGLRAAQVVSEMAPAPVVEEDVPTKHTVAGMEVTGDGPLVVREKEFSSAPLTLAQALDEMELVGHDFFLYVDAESELPSVVYRRKGYDYGVIHLSKA
ncbi:MULTISPECIES: ribosome hibernation-promoting factor, HPF/YfiA family [unclassified Luteococcus]|uniref:ribosome hibernation-promoting factor, HPF/YfiA family n=1 Tax=unclassified Luteococcus TaxID=2639923 RepID=UPI00313B5BBB